MQNSPVHILLVEDDEDDYLIIKDLLSDIEETTFQIDWVSEYDEAKQRIHPHRYDVFLFDYRLGRHTGLDLVRYVRTIKPSSPCILLTGGLSWFNSRIHNTPDHWYGLTDLSAKRPIPGRRVRPRKTSPVWVRRHLSGKTRGLRILLGMERTSNAANGMDRRTNRGSYFFTSL